MTNDADIVVDADEAQILALVRLLVAEFYVSEDAAKDAVRHKSMFNAIHLKTAFKVDLVVKKNRSFSDEERQGIGSGGRSGVVRPHPGQIDSASNLRALLVDSEIAESHVACDRVQDAYSFRCESSTRRDHHRSSRSRGR